MSANTHGPYVLARLLTGVPADAEVADGLGEPWDDIAAEVLSANGEGRMPAFHRAVDWRPDGAELKAAVFAVDPSAEAPAPPPARFTVIGAADIMARPDPTWAVYRHLAVGQVSVWYGRPGSTKTFELIDLSCDTATGLRWLGKHEVRQGAVIYVSAEGVGGMAKRLRAWVRRRGATLEQLHFIEQAPNLTDPGDVDLLIAQIQALSNDVQLVALDPLNFCLGDGDENSAGDMGKAMASLQRIARALACHVAVAHHANKGGSEERGSSAIRAAADTMIQVTNEDAVITLECTKQRDAEQFAPVHLKLVVVPEDDSCVVEPADQNAEHGQLSVQQRRALEALHSTALDDGASTTEWMDVSGIQRSTFFFARKKLLDGAYISKVGRRFSLLDKGLLAVAQSKKSNGCGAALDRFSEEKSNATQGNESGGDSKGADHLVQESNGSPMGVQWTEKSNSPISLKGRSPLDYWTGLDSCPDEPSFLAGEDDRGGQP